MTTKTLSESIDLAFPFPVTAERPLSELCTFRIGGPARYYTEVDSIAKMQEVIRFCHNHDVPYIVLGKGSNSLFDDRGFNGLAIGNKIGFCEKPTPDQFHVGAGFSFSRLGTLTARQGWTGLEFASGIPCSVGGAVFMNAGANGAETADHLVTVDYVTESGELQVIEKKDLHFNYRHSSFQQRRGAIVGALFRLRPDQKARESQLAILNTRMKSQPYQDPSAGCAFRNPDPAVSPLSAGALIDRAGLKGFTVGGAGVSTLHANFLINCGGATSQDVIQLMQQVRERVRERFQVELEPEIRRIPYDLEHSDDR